MKGAMALPCASTINAPNNAMISKIGSSQNFFLALRKEKSSFRKDKMRVLRATKTGAVELIWAR